MTIEDIAVKLGELVKIPAWNRLPPNIEVNRCFDPFGSAIRDSRRKPEQLEMLNHEPTALELLFEASLNPLANAVYEATAHTPTRRTEKLAINYLNYLMTMVIPRFFLFFFVLTLFSNTVDHQPNGEELGSSPRHALPNSSPTFYPPSTDVRLRVLAPNARQLHPHGDEILSAGSIEASPLYLSDSQYSQFRIHYLDSKRRSSDPSEVH